MFLFSFAIEDFFVCLVDCYIAYFCTVYYMSLYGLALGFHFASFGFVAQYRVVKLTLTLYYIALNYLLRRNCIPLGIYRPVGHKESSLPYTHINPRGTVEGKIFTFSFFGICNNVFNTNAQYMTTPTSRQGTLAVSRLWLWYG